MTLIGQLPDDSAIIYLLTKDCVLHPAHAVLRHLCPADDSRSKRKQKIQLSCQRPPSSPVDIDVIIARRRNCPLENQPPTKHFNLDRNIE
ncbi:hypothetical protein BaRGS_00010695 [Batillaria attramentaria]|uniref:Uncharacterized protein n=1 Tax=Batillaria attramentaria TaxID=370345 RepID=A0ABD0LF54_9CAEN